MVEAFSIFGVRVEKRGCITGFNFAIPEWETNSFARLHVN